MVRENFDLLDAPDVFIGGDTNCYCCGARIWTHLSVWAVREPWYRCADGCVGGDDTDDVDELFDRYAG